MTALAERLRNRLNPGTNYPRAKPGVQAMYGNVRFSAILAVACIVFSVTPSAIAAPASNRPSASEARLFITVVERELLGGNALTYDKHSLRDLRIVPADHGIHIRAVLTYNGGSPGWVEASIDDGEVACLIYWNYQNDCVAPTYGGTLEDNRNENHTPYQDPSCPRGYMSFGTDLSGRKVCIPHDE